MLPALLLAFILSLPSRTASADGRLTVLEAMVEEGARSMARLRIAGFEAPYYLAYEVKDLRQEEVAGRYGALYQDSVKRTRRLFVDVRVGSYDLDSSGHDDGAILLGSDADGYSPPRDGPIDDSPQALRNALWLLTDEKYKEALTSYLRVRSKRVYREDEPKRAPSFSREPPEHHLDEVQPFAFDHEHWAGEIRRLTALFQVHPLVFDGAMKVEGEKELRWFTSSEGSTVVTEGALFGLHLKAVARAVDGQLLEDSRDYYAHSESGLPRPEFLEQEVRALIAELEALRTAPVLDPYTGPAILGPEATGVLFHEAIGHRLEGDRQDDEKEGQTFKGQIGKPVLPSFLSVVDDPTLRREGTTELSGAYAFDDQGVPAERTVLVQDGVLRGYLLSRRPVNPFAHSNGHARSQGSLAPMARMGNLIVSSTHRLPMAELKRLLILEAKRQGKPFGLIIRDVSGGSTNTGSYGYQAFKGTPRLAYRVDLETGREELVRGVELVGTPLASVSRVIATGDEEHVFNGYCGAESGYLPVSTIAPAALVSEVELQRVTGANERGPILPAPWTDMPSTP